MTLPRRQFLRVAAGAAALSTLSQTARGQAYPVRPVRITVGVAAGSAPDIVARLIAQWLSERLGQPFVVENRPGAGTNIATESVIRAAADGYTLLLVGAPNAINAALYQKLKFNFLRDIAPVASIVLSPEVLVVHPSVPAKTIPEFVAYAKANPGLVSMASPGIGSGPHMSGELFKAMADINMTHAPYRGGGPVMTDLISGHVQVTFTAPTVVLSHISTGQARALAVTTAKRLDLLPDVHTIAEFLPGYESGGFFGIGAPKNTPSEVIDKLNKEINSALVHPLMKSRMIEMGTPPIVGSPDDFRTLIVRETEKWAKVVAFADVKVE
jgi:tripartite-type tricarboxylate transporter receptor subunit TctC